MSCGFRMIVDSLTHALSVYSEFALWPNHGNADTAP